METRKIERLAKGIPGFFTAKTWARGTRTRVYLRYVRGYQGGAGGGEAGYVERDENGTVSFATTVSRDELAVIKAALVAS